MVSCFHSLYQESSDAFNCNNSAFISNNTQEASLLGFGVLALSVNSCVFSKYCNVRLLVNVCSSSTSFVSRDVHSCEYDVGVGKETSVDAAELESVVPHENYQCCWRHLLTVRGRG